MRFNSFLRFIFKPFAEQMRLSAYIFGGWNLLIIIFLVSYRNAESLKLAEASVWNPAVFAFGGALANSFWHILIAHNTFMFYSAEYACGWYEEGDWFFAAWIPAIALISFGIYLNRFGSFHLAEFAVLQAYWLVIAKIALAILKPLDTAKPEIEWYFQSLKHKKEAAWR